MCEHIIITTQISYSSVLHYSTFVLFSVSRENNHLQHFRLTL